MLARRPKRQKPCPALSFQNAEQGFTSVQQNSDIYPAKLRYLNLYGFVGVAAGGGAAAAGAAAAGATAAPPSFGVARYPVI